MSDVSPDLFGFYARKSLSSILRLRLSNAHTPFWYPVHIQKFAQNPSLAGIYYGQEDNSEVIRPQMDVHQSSWIVSICGA